MDKGVFFFFLLADKGEQTRSIAIEIMKLTNKKLSPVSDHLKLSGKTLFTLAHQHPRTVRIKNRTEIVF